MSDSLWPHGLQNARPPWPSPTPRIYSNSRPLSQWCHPTILSSIVPFSSCLQSFPASESFQMSQLLASSGQSIGVLASASVLPMNIQDGFPLEWTGWISFSPRDSKEIKPVHPKGNQSWMFPGRTDAEAKTPILWPPDVKNTGSFIGKDPDPEKDWRPEEKGMTEDEMVGWHHRLNGHEFE